MKPDFICHVRNYAFYGDTPAEAYGRFSKWLEIHQNNIPSEGGRHLNVMLGQTTFIYSDAHEKYVVSTTGLWVEDIHGK